MSSSCLGVAARGGLDRLGTSGGFGRRLRAPLGQGTDPDVARLDLIRLGDRESQQPVLERGGRGLCLDVGRERNRAAERTAADLLVEVPAIFVALLRGAVSRDRQRVTED